eukprot:gene4854-27809_t
MAHPVLSATAYGQPLPAVRDADAEDEDGGDAPPATGGISAETSARVDAFVAHNLLPHAAAERLLRLSDACAAAVATTQQGTAVAALLQRIAACGGADTDEAAHGVRVGQGVYVYRGHVVGFGLTTVRVAFAQRTR